ncbi:MAG: hypothetical protein ACRDLP_09150 [Solirubrobacteraceae bacterium]
MVYQSDPQPAPERDFQPADLRLLAVGNRGRLLDARRTPIEIVAVSPQVGSFVVEVRAFEDAGVRWELALDEIARFQLVRDAATLAPAALAELETAQARFSGSLTVEADAGERAQTLRWIAMERGVVSGLFDREGLALDPDSQIERREGDPRLYALLEALLLARDVAEIDRTFAHAFVTNPRSGEHVKGHAIVLAELGLGRYEGPVVRGPDLFGGVWAKPRRAQHLVTRLAFSAELWTRLRGEHVTLYRGAATDAPPPPRAPASFLSATFSREVALAHFEGGPTTTTAALWRASIPVDRLLMTFLETEAMNSRFREAEAVLIGDLDSNWLEHGGLAAGRDR